MTKTELIQYLETYFDASRDWDGQPHVYPEDLAEWLIDSNFVLVSTPTESLEQFKDNENKKGHI